MPILTVNNNDFAAQWQDTHETVLAACERVGRSGWYVLGQEVAGFEAALADFWGLAHAVGTGNGMDALEIALRAGGLVPGERVLTTPLSAFASTLAIVRAGGIPVYLDTDAAGLLDLDLLEETLAAHSEIRWVLPVHLYGHCLDLTRLAMLRDRFGLKIVEDCAQSIGASFRGKAAGSVGYAAATSFYPTKNLGAMGDAGAILTNDADLAVACRTWRDYGQQAKYEHTLPGLNSRLDELQAAILRSAMLPKLAGQTQRRREIAQAYASGLSSPHVLPLLTPEGSESVFHLYPVTVGPHRVACVEYLKNCQIQSAIHYPTLLPEQPAMAKIPYEIATPLTSAKKLAESEISLPIHPYLTNAQVEHVINSINQWQPSP